MSFEIKYTNEDNEPITMQQLNVLEPHNKHFYENNKLKKIEQYRFIERGKKFVLSDVEYYISSEENLNAIINEYVSESLNYFVAYYNNQSNSFGDQYWEYNIYKRLSLITKGKKVFTNEGLLLASCLIDINTGLISDRWKHFYGDKSIYKRIDYEDHFLSITYDDSNVVKIYVSDDDYFLDGFLESHYADIFVWNNHPYYHSFEPMLPIGPL